MSTKRYLSAREAAAELGVNLKTLYAYVSRGQIRSEAAGGSRQSRAYLAEDIYRLKERKELRRNPEKAASQALQWGDPVLDSALTLIKDDHVYYRGQDAISLAETHTIEQVAALLWGFQEQEGYTAQDLFQKQKPGEEMLQLLRRFYTSEFLCDLPLLEQFQAALPRLAAGDLAAYNMRPEAIIETGTRFLWLFTACLSRINSLQASIAETLQQAWAPDHQEAARLFNAALILNADNELTVPAFTARCVSSTNAPLYAVMQAALAAFHGINGGGRYLRALQFLREVCAPQRARGPLTVLEAYLKQGERLPGFQHRLFPVGDTRPIKLLQMLREAYPAEPVIKLAWTLIEEVERQLGLHPHMDLAYAVLGMVLGLEDEQISGLFTLARSVGIIGHALEQYQSKQEIRPRARYIGIQP